MILDMSPLFRITNNSHVLHSYSGLEIMAKTDGEGIHCRLCPLSSLLYKVQDGVGSSYLCWRHMKEEKDTLLVGQRKKVPCNVCGDMTRKNCAKCLCSYYCGSECQKKDWLEHKKECLHHDSGKEIWKKEYTEMMSSPKWSMRKILVVGPPLPCGNEYSFETSKNGKSVSVTLIRHAKIPKKLPPGVDTVAMIGDHDEAMHIRVRTKFHRVHSICTHKVATGNNVCMKELRDFISQYATGYF